MKSKKTVESFFNVANFSAKSKGSTKQRLNTCSWVNLLESPCKSDRFGSRSSLGCKPPAPVARAEQRELSGPQAIPRFSPEEVLIKRIGDREGEDGRTLNILFVPFMRLYPAAA